MAVVTSAPLEHQLSDRLDRSELSASMNDHVAFGPSFDEKASIATGKEHLLLVSPYDEEPHLLDLRTLDTSNQILAKALTALKCLRSDYATAPYVDIFNWNEVVGLVRELAANADFKWIETSFYIVVFRSQIPPTTVYGDLGVLDKAAHAEATESGGFLKYWFGSPDQEGRNLATCVWRTQLDARVGSVGEAHRRAGNAARFLYTEWKIERLRFTIKDDVTEWSIDQWIA